MTTRQRHTDPTAGTRERSPGSPWSPGSPDAANRLARRANGFPVQRVAIIGQDLQMIEQVTGKLDYPRAAWRGAVSGAVPGALIGWIFGLFDWVDPLISSLLLALYGLIIGAVVGAIIGLVIYALQRGARDFESVTVMRPQRYEVVVDDEVADQAAHQLGQGV
jgi:hypothetical protein